MNVIKEYTVDGQTIVCAGEWDEESDKPMAAINAVLCERCNRLTSTMIAIRNKLVEDAEDIRTSMPTIEDSGTAYAAGISEGNYKGLLYAAQLIADEYNKLKADDEAK